MPIPNPRPIALRGDVPANHTADAPAPFVIVAAGYDPTKTQTLKHVNGVFQFVTDAA